MTAEGRRNALSRSGGLCANPPFHVRILEADCLSGGHQLTLESGPALLGKPAVLTTWMPACCSPLNGVTTGLACPGSQPSLKGTFGLLNQTPRWNWCVGANFVVPPGDTENVSLLNMPWTVTVPEPLAPAWMSDWYHDTPNGLFGSWMTNRSKSLFAGMPHS